MDTNDELWQRATELHERIIGASEATAWEDSGKASGVPAWQWDVIGKILTMTYDQEIEYLSTATPEDRDWDIIAFTHATVVRVLMARADGATSHTETTSFPRSSLESLELIEVAPLPTNGDIWPSELNMIGHYQSATVTLPLDKFASTDNKRALVRLLTSLLQDVAH